MNLKHLAPVVSFLLGGCISYNTPGDLTFETIQAVDYFDQAELHVPSAAFLITFMSERDIANAGLLEANEEKPHRLLLKTSFISQLNLSKFASDGGYNLGNWAYFCERPDDHVILSNTLVYWQGTILRGNAEMQDVGQKTKPPFTYDVFLGVTRKETLPSNPPLVGFDLRKKPEDVCMNLKGGDGAGFGYASNTVVVPKDAIALALQDIPQSVE